MEKYSEILHQVLEPYADILRCFVEGTGSLQPFRYKKSRESRQDDSNSNDRERLRLILALEYHPELQGPRVEELTRWLFSEQIKACENDSFQGIGMALEVSGYLLKQYGRRGDEALFKRAKAANFDTAAGYDPGQPPCLRSLEEESLESCLFMAEEMGADQAFSKLADIWIEDQEEWNAGNLSQRRALERYRGNEVAELEILKDILELRLDSGIDWEICAAAENLAEALLGLGHFSEAWEAVQIARLHLEEDWHHYGLGRSLIDISVQIVLEDHRTDAAEEAWTWIYPYLKQMDGNNMGSIMLKRAVKAAEMLGHAELLQLWAPAVEKYTEMGVY